MSFRLSRTWIRTASLVGVGLAVGAAQANAQTRGGHIPANVRVVGGIAHERATFGDDSPKPNAGRQTTIGVQISTNQAGGTAWVFEAALQLGSLDNPHPIDETLTELYLLVGPRLGRRTYARLGGGVSAQSWSGFFLPSGFAIAGGGAVGHELSRGRLLVSPEIVVRASMAIGILTRWVGVQVPVRW